MQNTAFYADRLDCCCRHGAPGPLEARAVCASRLVQIRALWGTSPVNEVFAIQGKDSLVMAEEATGEAAVPEVRNKQ